MRKWTDLTKLQQTRAVNKILNEMLEAILEGAIRFNDEANRNTLQAAIDGAMAEAERMQTPWFAGEHIMDATFVDEFRPGEELSVADELRGMAETEAEDAVYPDLGERVVQL